ncbi:anthranilate synthase component I family protein [Geothrix sp. PMB-07]|uniref:chorismate-binding protein n=1 Tax=Geothrix sp. PMB-07 TaxID=3068640 RepID=UPI002741F073|nr:anthranilate synthase component I family protein [Geothrix sp. PMB-07]WLT33327.1 anthranilate synthase component I family protein [Geothrix sp. PMB-07]
MDLAPRHRLPFPLPAPWPACAQGLLRSGAAWLHTGDTGEGLLGLPGMALKTTWTGETWTTTLNGKPQPESPWEALEGALRRHPFPWVGAATFELACDEAGLPRKPLPEGQLGQHWLGLQEALHVKDGAAELWSWGATPPDPIAWQAHLSPTCALGRVSVDLASDWGPSQHRSAVETIQSRILEGGFYVANLCVPFTGRLSGDPVTFALSCFRRARPPFGALLELGGLRLLSLSMERLLARRGERLWSQPIKGSAPLTGDPALDAAAAKALATDPKERAEHTMILDLIRNDLGRVARSGSVQVIRPMTVEPYPTVQHLVSTVEAAAKPGLGLAELLRAVLPGGSITGAPKHAVCRHLAGAEAAPRGFYCGAVGWIAPNGDLDLALPIRTAQIQGEQLTYWAGGGITRRSDPQREWEELHLKTRALLGG